MNKIIIFLGSTPSSLSGSLIAPLLYASSVRFRSASAILTYECLELKMTKPNPSLLLMGYSTSFIDYPLLYYIYGLLF